MKRIIERVLLVLVIMVGITCLAGCGKKDKNTIVGSWAHDSYVYTFNADKTGDYAAFGGKMEFTYEDDGKELKILYTGNTVPLVLPYRIEGKKLIVTDSFGSDVEYVKK